MGSNGVEKHLVSVSNIHKGQIKESAEHFYNTTVQMIKHWHRSPRESVESPSLKIFM